MELFKKYHEVPREGKCRGVVNFIEQDERRNLVWKNFWLMVGSIVLGAVIVLLLLIGIAKFFVWENENKEEELVMNGGKLFACREFREFQILSSIFSDETVSNDRKVNLATILIERAVLSHRCEFLDPPLFLSDSKVIGDRTFPLKGEREGGDVLLVSVHQKNNDKLFYSLVFRVGGKKLDFVFFTIVVLGRLENSSGEQKDMSETF